MPSSHPFAPTSFNSSSSSSSSSSFSTIDSSTSSIFISYPTSLSFEKKYLPCLKFIPHSLHPLPTTTLSKSTVSSTLPPCTQPRSATFHSTTPVYSKGSPKKTSVSLTLPSSSSKPRLRSEKKPLLGSVPSSSNNPSSYSSSSTVPTSKSTLLDLNTRLLTTPDLRTLFCSTLATLSDTYPKRYASSPFTPPSSSSSFTRTKPLKLQQSLKQAQWKKVWTQSRVSSLSSSSSTLPSPVSSTSLTTSTSSIHSSLLPTTPNDSSTSSFVNLPHPSHFEKEKKTVSCSNVSLIRPSATSKTHTKVSSSPSLSTPLSIFSNPCLLSFSSSSRSSPTFSSTSKERSSLVVIHSNAPDLPISKPIFDDSTNSCTSMSKETFNATTTTTFSTTTSVPSTTSLLPPLTSSTTPLFSFSSPSSVPWPFLNPDALTDTSSTKLIYLDAMSWVQVRRKLPQVPQPYWSIPVTPSIGSSSSLKLEV